MKNHTPRSYPLLPLTVLVLALLAGPAITAAENTPALNPALPGGTNTPRIEDLKSHPFTKRDNFSADVQTIVAKLDTRISELDARQAGEPANDRRKQAIDEARTARADLGSKLDAISNVSAETWPTVRDNVLAALTRVQSACDKAAKS